MDGFSVSDWRERALFVINTTKLKLMDFNFWLFSNDCALNSLNKKIKIFWLNLAESKIDEVFISHSASVKQSKYDKIFLFHLQITNYKVKETNLV